jgi:hypothetical protein
MIAVLAVAIGQGRSLLGGDGRHRPTRQPAARTSFALGDAPSRRESTLTVAALVGGVRGSTLTRGGLGGVLHVTFCPGGGRIRAERPCASTHLQHPRKVGPPDASSHPA